MLPFDPFSLIGAFSYSALIVGTVIAQPATALVAGILAAAHIARFDVLFATIFIIDMCMDTVWYMLGLRQGMRVFGWIERLFRVRPEYYEHLLELFHRRPALIIISAKVFGGFGILPVILFAAGSARMPFGRYIALNAIGEVVWTGGLMAIGYFFSAAQMNVPDVPSKAVILGVTLALAVAFVYIMRWLRGRVLG